VTLRLHPLPPDTVNGIPSNHFSFKLAGLGKESGAVVRNNKGDYWLARDGQYLVKYALAFEVATAAQGSAQAQVYKADVTFDLTNVNAPVASGPKRMERGSVPPPMARPRRWPVSRPRKPPAPRVSARRAKAPRL